MKSKFQNNIKINFFEKFDKKNLNNRNFVKKILKK